MRALRTWTAATLAAATMWLAPASAQQANTVELIVLNGRLRITGTCNDLDVEVIRSPGFGAQVTSGTGTGTATLSLTYSFDLSDGSTPTAPDSITVDSVPGPTAIFQINTREATGSITMTAEPPPGWSIDGPSTVTAEILIQRDASDCTPTAVTSTPPAVPAVPGPPAAQPVATAPAYTG